MPVEDTLELCKIIAKPPKNVSNSPYAILALCCTSYNVWNIHTVAPSGTPCPLPLHRLCSCTVHNEVIVVQMAPGDFVCLRLALVKTLLRAGQWPYAFSCYQFVLVSMTGFTQHCTSFPCPRIWMCRYNLVGRAPVGVLLFLDHYIKIFFVIIQSNCVIVSFGHWPFESRSWVLIGNLMFIPSIFTQ